MAVRHDINHRWKMLEWLATSVDADSAAAQPILNVASTVGYAIGDPIIIDPDASGGGLETGVIASIQVGDSLTLTTNLANNHTALQADAVLRDGSYHQTWPCIRKTMLLTAANITAVAGFTVTTWGKIGSTVFALDAKNLTAVADNKVYELLIEKHYDEIKVAITDYVDGDLNVEMSGRK